MRKTLICALLATAFTRASAQNNYDVSLIPKDLLPYASAVIRSQEETVELKDLDNVICHVKKVVTILNQNGDDEADLTIPYDKNSSVRSIKGVIYDVFGKVQQKISERDFEDVAETDGFSLFQDSRAKHYTRAITQYPYTIEFEYETRDKQSFTFDNWHPNPGPEISVEKSSYTFICKPDYKFRYKELNLSKSPTTGTTKDGFNTYTWQAFMLKARRYEPLSPGWRSLAGALFVAPSNFKYGQYNGSYTDWQQFGKWTFDHFIATRQTLPDQTVQYVKELTSNISDPKLKAKKIYEYMQQKTHYISVQVGIGGYQPFDASEVDKDGYGDCKALVNYTRALLKVAGIDSWYCLVYGNPEVKYNVTSDFASQQGNHAILCIPFKNDTTWLECTNQQLPFGYLGDFTDDRTVLACTPEGGKLLHTPKYAADKNTVTRKANFTLSESGDLAGQMQTTFKGLEYDDRDPTIEKAKTEWSKDFKKYYGINNVFIKKLDYKQEKTIDPVTSEQVELSARDYGAITDGKYYFSLNSVDHTTSSIKHIRNRANPVTITHGRTFVDEITYNLPKGYQLDSEPLNVSIDKTFGNFTATMSIKGDQLIYTRKFQIKDGTYDKDIYQDIADFYDAVIDADNYNVTLVKK